MNREAVALGTPVYTTFEGKLGAVDERLLREGRMQRLSDPAQIALEKRQDVAGMRVRRDPRRLVELLLSP
jgi:predicted glycosyltransferase